MTSETFADLDRRFADTMARARAQAAAMSRAADELGAVRGCARSPDASVEAVVDGAGALVALWLAESVTRLPADHVGRVIVVTVAAAENDALRHRDNVISDLTDTLRD